MADGFGRPFGGKGCLPAGLLAFHLSGFEGVTTFVSNRPAGGPRGGTGRFIGVGGWFRVSGSIDTSSGFPVFVTTKSASSKTSPKTC